MNDIYRVRGGKINRKEELQSNEALILADGSVGFTFANLVSDLPSDCRRRRYQYFKMDKITY